MSIELFKRIVDLGSVLTGVSLILCLYHFFKRDVEVRLQAIGFLASVLTVVYVEVVKLKGPSINVPQNLSMIPMIVPVLFMFDAAWKKRYRIVTTICIIVLITFAVWNFFLGQGMTNFNSYTTVMSSFVIIIHCMLFYHYLLVDLPVQKLSKLPMFWYNAAYLIFYGGSLFIFAAYVVDVFRDSLLLYWTIQNFLRIAQLILIIVGLCQDLRNFRLRSSLPSAR